MKKTNAKRLACLCAAALALCSALIVSAFNGSPYEILKKSLFDATGYMDTAERFEQTLYLDGVKISNSRTTQIRGKESSISYSGENGGLSYNSGEYNLYSMAGYGDTGETWYSAGSPGYFYSSSGGILGVVGNITGPYRRFAELAVDLLVGSLKNNITMTEEDGTRLITGTLTAYQIPELYNAALDMLYTEAVGSRIYHLGDEEISIDLKRGVRRYKSVTLRGLEKVTDYYEQTFNTSPVDALLSGWGFTGPDGLYYSVVEERYEKSETEPASKEDYDALYSSSPSLSDSLLMQGRQARLTYLHGEALVDAKGRLTKLTGSATVEITDLFGETLELEYRLDMEFSDIGTARAECPIQGVGELLSEYTSDIYNSANIIFKLGEDGTIDRSSVIDRSRQYIQSDAEISEETLYKLIDKAIDLGLEIDEDLLLKLKEGLMSLEEILDAIKELNSMTAEY